MLDTDTKQEVKDMISDAVGTVIAFSTKKLGDTPTDDLQLVPKKYVDANETTVAVSGNPALKGAVVLAAGNNITLTQTSQIITIAETTGGIALSDLFGDGSDGAATISSPTTLTRDMYYSSLTFSADITTAGWQIFCTGAITRTGTAKIVWNGNAGGAGNPGIAGSPGNGGSAGTALTGHTVPGALAGIAGSTGGTTTGNGNGGAGNNGNNGVGTNPSIGSSGGVGTDDSLGAGGNAGGNSGGVGGTGGAAGTATLALNPPHTLNGCYIHADLLSTYIAHVGSASCGAAGSGGGGAGTGGSAGGGGGGSGGGGGCGGCIVVYASSFVDNGSGDMFQAIGGAGGNGGAGGPATTGGNQAGGGQGGSGGRGGTGGVVIRVYHTKTGSCSVNILGGAASTHGNGGAGGGGGQIGSDGSDGGQGPSGISWDFIV